MATHIAREPMPAGTTGETMKAVVIRAFGEPDVLTVEEVRAPQPAEGEVVVRIAAVEVSRNRDVATRSGRHPFSRAVTLPHVLGGASAGVVERLGAGVDESLIGRRVAVMDHYACGWCPECLAGQVEDCSALVMVGIHRWGSYAEFVCIPASNVHPVPEDLDLVEAAAMAATGPVALTQLRTVGAGVGSTVIVPGMTGSLATTVGALATVLGSKVIGLSRRPEKVPASSVHAVVDSSRSDIADAILAANNGGRPDAVIDNVCSPRVFEQYFDVLANGASVAVSGVIGDPGAILPVPARDLYSRSIAVRGVRSFTEAVTLEFWDLVRNGFRLPTGVTHEFALHEAASAHQAIIDGSVEGHTMLRVSDDYR